MYIDNQIKAIALLLTLSFLSGCTSPSDKSYLIHHPAIYATQPTSVDDDGNATSPQDIFPWANGTKGIAD
jgi:hypothetical protein